MRGEELGQRAASGEHRLEGAALGDLALVRSAQATYGFAINPHRFAVTGRCSNCQ